MIALKLYGGLKFMVIGENWTLCFIKPESKCLETRKPISAVCRRKWFEIKYTKPLSMEWMCD